MKTTLTYGFLLTLCNFLVTVALFACGLQSDAAKIAASGRIAGLVGLAIAIACIAGGIVARRKAAPAGAAFSYGQAWGAGWLVQLWASIFGLATTYLYLTVINPKFTDLMVQMRLDKLAARGLTGDQLDRAESMLRLLSSPLAQTIANFIGTLILGAIIALIAAAFLKRAADESVSA
jgi:hypothetical protein